MFGLEILDIVIGLSFIYLLLALMATAANEYLAALLNKRGEELAKGIARLLDDIDGKDALKRAFNGVNPKAEQSGQTLTEQFYRHPLIRPLATPRGWVGRSLGMKEIRLPSYIPARTFALAMLDILGYDDADVRPEQAAPVPAPIPGQPTAAPLPSAPQRAQLNKVLELLQRESPLDVSEHLGGLKGLLENASLPEAMKLQLVGTVTNAQTRLQKLHDSTEVWFNNSMDRVSGAYKRHTQAFLFLIGMVLACMLNADTIQMWKQLAGNDALRTAMAERAARLIPALDSLVHDTAAAQSPQSATGQPDRNAGTTTVDTPAPAANPTNPAVPPVGTTPATDTAPGSTTLALVEPTNGTGTTPPANDSTSGNRTTLPDSLARAKQKYEAARLQLDSMELKLGWTWEEAVRVGLARPNRQDTARQQPVAPKAWPDNTRARPDSQKARSDTAGPASGRKVRPYRLDFFPIDNKPGNFSIKLLGLLMTALAISMGAPFWFDTLNKVISIRGAGRSPTERAKSPEGPAKRAAEQPNK